jgi:uncharacterized protein
MSSREFRGDHLDVAAFAKDAGELSGQTALAAFERLRDSLHPGAEGQGVVRWSAQGRTVAQRGGAFEIWVDLQADVTMGLTCQSCLDAVETPLTIDRAFRFVANEQLAAELDETSEDDVLVASRNFDLMALLEDELLLALPLVPRHEVCPKQLPLPAGEDFVTPDGLDLPVDEATDTPNPFAALQALKSGPH